MRKNVFLVFFLAAAFLVVGVVSENSRAADDPVEAIRNAKTPVHMHSLASGDDLVNAWASVVGSEWESMYPPSTYGHQWKCTQGQDNSLVGWLSHSDKLRMKHMPTGDSIWVWVDTVTITLVVGTPVADTTDTAYLEFRNPPSPDILDTLIRQTTIPSWEPLHEIWPTYCNEYTITAVDLGVDSLINTGDSIQTNGDTWWIVLDVAVDAEVFSVADPTVPTMTQWGIVILVALIVGSSIFIMVRRRRAAVPA